MTKRSMLDELVIPSTKMRNLACPENTTSFSYLSYTDKTTYDWLIKSEVFERKHKYYNIMHLY